MNGIITDTATGEYTCAGLVFARGIARELVRDLKRLEADIAHAIEDSHSNVYDTAITACEDLDITLEAAVSFLSDMAECYSSWREVFFSHFMNDDDKEIAPAITHKGNDIIALSSVKEKIIPQ